MYRHTSIYLRETINYLQQVLFYLKTPRFYQRSIRPIPMIKFYFFFVQTKHFMRDETFNKHRSWPVSCSG